jgi:hypothetical protein
MAAGKIPQDGSELLAKEMVIVSKEKTVRTDFFNLVFVE